jgi:hypothetical protein
MLKRAYHESFGEISPEQADMRSLSGVSSDNPLSDLYNPAKVGDKPTDLVTFLLAEQRKVYGYTYLDRLPYPALVKHAKLLLKKYSPQLIKRGIALSVRWGKYPASFKFVEGCILKIIK